MDPATYDEEQYRAHLLQKMRQSELVVYEALFAPEIFAPEPILVAATSSGMLHVFVMSPMLQPAYWEQVTKQEATAYPGPNFSFQAHPTQIYSLSFAGDVSNPLLISGGDQDMRVWRWKDILAAVDAAGFKAETQLKPLHVVHLERKTLGFRGAMLPYNEINDVAVAGDRVFLAGGDSRAHEWDLASQQFVRQYEGHQEYLHTLRYLTHSQELLTGSEDGSIGIWDVRQATKAAFLHPQPKHASKNGARQASIKDSLWVGCVANDPSEMWLACGGGSKTRESSGFVSMWHLPSRVAVHYTETPTEVHDVAFHHMDLLSVGSEASLKKWNRSSGALLATAHSTVPSCHFCVVDNATDIVAVGGNAPLIDIYAMPGVVSFSLLVDESKPLRS